MPCPMLYILNCQDKYNWEQQGNEEKTGRQRYTGRKLVGWALAGEASALPLSMDLNREAGYYIQQNRR